MLNDQNRRALQAFSRGDMTAIELRRRLDGASYGDVLRLLSDERLPLPQASVAGREEQIDRAHAWMFPDRVA